MTEHNGKTIIFPLYCCKISVEGSQGNQQRLTKLILLIALAYTASIEFCNVATRPIDKNGLGMTPVKANVEITQFETLLPIKLDVPHIGL